MYFNIFEQIQFIIIWFFDFFYQKCFDFDMI